MDILWGEHRIIEQILDVLTTLRTLAADQRKIPAEDARIVIDLLRTFADTCHHGKEEDLLFPALEAASGGTFQPVDVMRDEHVVGRNHIAAMALAIDRDDVATFCVEAGGYIDLLREHIRKEDHCLFGFARNLLDDQTCADLLEAFHRVEHEDLGSGVHERMLNAANTLADRYGVAKASDDPQVLRLVTAHCGCPIGDEADGIDLEPVSSALARLRPMADRVGLVHRGHDPRVNAVAGVVADLQNHLAVWEKTPADGSPLERLKAQDQVRGDCRRLAALTDGFTCFADACGTAVKLYGGLQAMVQDLETALDAVEQRALRQAATPVQTPAG